jgi:hypothetical protein
MAIVTPAQRLFTKGEVSPLLSERSDYDGYDSALAHCLNQIPLIEGPLTRRPGTYYAAPVRYSNKYTRLVEFNFNDEQAYVLEFGDLYMRIYMDEARVESPPGTPVEIVTPYLEVDLPLLHFQQSNDILYITHPDYAPRQVNRSGITTFSITTYTNRDGPYLAENITSTTLTPAATSGSGVTLTASSTAGINNGVGFRSGDVGRFVRIKHTNWGVAKIASFVSTTQVTINIEAGFDSATASSVWRLGTWNSADGYPTCSTIFESRHCFGGSGASPSTVDLGVSDDYGNFEPSELAGSIADDHSLFVRLDSDTAERILWLAGDERGLIVGTGESEWLIRGSEVQRTVVTPTNRNAKQVSYYGSKQVQPRRIEKALMFVQRAGRALRELAYVYADDKFSGPNMSVTAQHLTTGNGGIKHMAYAKIPHSILWIITEDYRLLGFTYNREQAVLAWHHHTIGGSDVAPAQVRSVACIPAPDGTYTQTWLIVRRHIAGIEKQYVEYMGPVWEHRHDSDKYTDEEVALFNHLDSALTYDGVSTSAVTGLDHLANHEVSVRVDGARHPNVTVSSSGSITLNYPGQRIVVGLDYNSEGTSLRFDAGAQNGSSQGKKQKIQHCRFKVRDTNQMKAGPSLDNLSEIPFRRSIDSTDTAVPLFSGIVEVKPWESGFDVEESVSWRFNGGGPATLQSILPRISTEDGS